MPSCWEVCAIRRGRDRAQSQLAVGSNKGLRRRSKELLKAGCTSKQDEETQNSRTKKRENAAIAVYDGSRGQKPEPPFPSDADSH